MADEIHYFYTQHGELELWLHGELLGRFIRSIFKGYWVDPESGTMLLRN